ncbi:MAG: c-type cytochrome [Actinobacteria bacterium]|nr:c-type cytochrome [Actinomycetota bacterium]
MAALAAPLLLAVVATPALVHHSSAEASARSQPVPSGRFLYLRDCGVCHGERGEGTPLGQRLTHIGPAEVDYTLSTGRMPVDEPGAERRRREPRYSRAERTAIVDFMRPFIAPTPDIPHVDVAAGDVAEGAELYLAQCAACHQWAGEGGALLGDIESPPLKDSTPVQIAEAIHSGPLNMPVFVLSDDEVNSIAAYVLYLRHPEDRGGVGLWHFGPLTEGAVAWLFGLGAVVMVCRWIGTRE